MKKWQPNQDNSVSAIVRGPSTRRLTRPRRRIRWTLKVLKPLSGQRLASWTTRAAAIQGRTGFSVVYEEASDLYYVHDTEVHAFSHPRRIWTLFQGQIARGKCLTYEYLLDQIEFSDGDNIIDVGANTGDLALAFRAMGRKVNVEAFEPSPGEFAALKRNLEACSAVINHRAHQLALWNSEGEGLTFYLKAAQGDSSLLPIEGATAEIKVPSRRLDDIIPVDEKRYRLLKLEAEGAEPEILEGATMLLPQIDYIAADVGFERGTDAQSTLPEVTNFLTQHNFEVVGFEAGRFVLLFRNRALSD